MNNLIESKYVSWNTYKLDWSDVKQELTLFHMIWIKIDKKANKKGVCRVI